MKRTVRSQPIVKLRKTFPHEWLLIQVDRFDRRTTTPLTGRVLAHSRLLEPLEKRAIGKKGLVYLVYGSDTLPQGYAAAF
ncbi:MAG: hypothetical protein HYU33_00520 [Candidatus Omnitrophica bacterium]|nr:hypothetical protein [Candidatus Omnitrophota bacterium]MBI3009550.1 hypothetical protein [Candidatus Omnitrophota bacterium]